MQGFVFGALREILVPVLPLAPAALGSFGRPCLSNSRSRTLRVVRTRGVTGGVAGKQRTLIRVRLEAALNVSGLHVAQNVPSSGNGQVAVLNAGG
eukprot:6197834-Pleurochrysis_carterae.AAC.6